MHRQEGRLILVYLSEISFFATFLAFLVLILYMLNYNSFKIRLDTCWNKSCNFVKDILGFSLLYSTQFVISMKFGLNFGNLNEYIDHHREI